MILKYVILTLYIIYFRHKFCNCRDLENDIINFTFINIYEKINIIICIVYIIDDY